MGESIKELRKKCVKEGIGFKSRVLSYIGVYITRILLPTPITPIQILFFWMALELIALLLLIPGKYIYALIGMIILQFAILLDNVDGQVLRYRKMKCKRGWYLDLLSHNIFVPLTFICLGIGIYNAFGQIEYVWLGFTTAVLSLMRETTYIREVLDVVEAARKKQASRNVVIERLNKIKSVLAKWFDLGECINIMFFGIVFYLWREVLWLYFIVITLNFMLKLSITYSAFKKYDKEFAGKEKNKK